MSDHIGETNGMIDHVGESNKMVCGFCGLPFVREQNDIRSFGCGSSFMEVCRPQWARSMTCLEIQNGQLQERIKRLEEAGDALLNAWLMPEESMEYSEWVALSADAKGKWYAAKEAKP